MRSIFFRSAQTGHASQHLLDPRRLQRHSRDKSQALVRSLCDNAYLGDATALCRVLGRYKMFVDTTDVGLSPHLLLDGYWEMWLTEALVDVLRPGMVAVDVGANLGYFTLLMADLVGPAGAAHAFEPNPSIAARLSKSIDVNGFQAWTSIHPDPLGAENGRCVALTVPQGEPKNAHIIADVEADGVIPLRTRRFDSYPELLHVDVIKIDAEGAELDIWRGMSGLFEQTRRPLTIFLEFAAARYADPAGFLDDIKASGFTLGEVSLGAGIRTRTTAQILAAPPTIDQMLMLRR
jgi:FkbM family methyltransferase